MNKFSMIRFALVSGLLALAVLSPLAVILGNGPDAQASVAPPAVAPPVDADAPSFPAPPVIDAVPVIQLAEVVVTGREARGGALPARSEAREPSCHQHALEQQWGAPRYPGDLRTSGGTVRVCD